MESRARAAPSLSPIVPAPRRNPLSFCAPGRAARYFARDEAYRAEFPGLRIAYAVVPRALLQALVSAHYLIGCQPATLQQAVVCDFMQEGHFAAHIRRMRQLYREQRDALAETLMRRAADRLGVAVPDQGMHLVAYLCDGSSEIAIEAAAQRAGIVVRAISRFYRSASVPRPHAGVQRFSAAVDSDRRPRGLPLSSSGTAELKLLHGQSRKRDVS
jgi:aspartate/methionine/tyrosine aminotransferase